MIATRVRRAVAAAALAVVLAAGAAVPAAAQQRAPDDATVTVMARNLYLGADVGAALELLPDLSAATQVMWDQVAQTDFDTRVTQLAAEAVRNRPDVIGVQEATTWTCRQGLLGPSTTVFDFTEQFVDATAAAGVPYVVAEQGGIRADNPGYTIPPIPTQTTAYDPATFQPLFTSDTADCGFTIGDAILVRADRADDVLAVGSSEYTERYAVVPVVFTVDRGYSWIDLDVDGTSVRVVTTHLESLWDEGAMVPSAVQARQLVDDLSSTAGPLVVIGDFNADPRDPRAPGDVNPGGQPTASDVCPPQPPDPTAATADATCNAYWTMVQAGYTDVGPDPLDPRFYTWGTASNLAGPDPERLPDALELGNAAGFTDRLDHIFVANGVTVVDAELVGNKWPQGEDLWPCADADQVATTEASSQILSEEGSGQRIVGRGVCLPTDHAGIVATVDVSGGEVGAGADPAPPAHDSWRIGLTAWLGIILVSVVLLLVLLVWGTVAFVRRRRRQH
jgi:hypothetical protein